MASIGSVTKVFRAIPDIGITPDIRPEEAKHIRYLNVGFALMIFISLAYLMQSMTDSQVPFIIPVAQLFFSVLAGLVFIFNRLGRYTVARIYGFLLYYIDCLILYTASGQAVLDHYFIFLSFGYAFLIFPRKENKLMMLVIALGIVCFFTIMLLYEYIPPLRQVDPAALKLQNQVIILVLIITFVIFLISGRYFTDEMEDSLMAERKKLSEMSDLLKKMFGRYLSTEVMNSLIEDPASLELGGEKRSVTIMMTDLRGFSALSERLEPEQVVQMLNAYFEIMVDVVLKYNGTINEFIGDALLVIFGAPQEMPDRAQRAVACAIEMQNAMAGVNTKNRALGLPELEMGIGLNETEVIVGNIGSSKRSKYAVVGSGVNLTSRIESYTVGGQILVSESVRREAGEVLRIDAQRDVFPKGSETALRIYEVGGIAGEFNLILEEPPRAFVTLVRRIPITYTLLEGKDIGSKRRKGAVVRLSRNCAEIKLESRVEAMTNLKMNLSDVDEKIAIRDFYGKVARRADDNDLIHTVYFTSVPPEIDSYFHAFRQHADIDKK
jgi:adenylate cyclase